MTAEAEVCYDCMRPLATDGVTWACKPCGRGGYYDRHRLRDGRELVVRMVTRYRPAPVNDNDRARRAA